MAACAQILYALRVLRKHGLCDDSLHGIFRSVAVAKLMHPSPGGDSPLENPHQAMDAANDRQKIFAFIRRCMVSVLQI